MKKKAPSRDEIVTKIDSLVHDCTGWANSSLLSKERTKVLDYYNGTKPVRQNAGSSSYVSNDVYDGIEMMKAQLLETFAAGHDIVKFTPQNEDDVDGCRVATDYAAYVVFRQNPGYEIFNNVIHDGLSARVGVAQAYWEERFEEQEETFEGLGEEEVTALAQFDEVSDLEAEQLEDGSWKGVLTKKVDVSQVRILSVAPEEFVITAKAKCLDSAALKGVRRSKTRAQLIEEGYDEKLLEEINWDTSSPLDMEPEHQSRHDITSTGREQAPMTEEAQECLVYEVFVKLDLEKKGQIKLYRCVYAESKVLLEWEEVDDHPFVVFVPLPLPHSFFGNNFAARIIPTQNAKTVLTRGILDHTAITNNPRWQVVKGGLTNPREMMDNRLGGLVNVTRPDAVMPLAQANLNPFVFQTIQLLDSDKEQTTGQSSLSQGLNKDAVSKQNSAAMIDSMVNLSQQRQKIIARNFANSFLVPLFLKVYDLVFKHEKKERIVELAGDWVPVDPTTWKARKDCTVSLHLGYGERDRRVQKLMGMYASIQADPELAKGFLPPNRYKLASDIAKLDGIQNVSDYLTAPEKIPPKEPTPIEQAMMEAQIRTTLAEAAKAEAEAKYTSSKSDVDMIRVEIEQMKATLEQFVKTRDTERKDLDVANRVDISQREIELAEAVPPENQRGIFSANS